MPCPWEGDLSDTTHCPVFVLTDTPAIYGSELYHQNVAPVFIKDIEELLDRLKDMPLAGLVLEVSKVMNATRTMRDRLFNYAGSFPVLRTKVNAQHGFVVYLDSREAFLSNLEAAIGKRARNHARVRVDFACAFSAENDPSMAESIEATVLDISPGGCFVHTTTPVTEHFVHLRLPSLSNSRPIYSSVRWTRNDGDANLRGMGVMFIDLTDDQQEEITAIIPST